MADVQNELQMPLVEDLPEDEWDAWPEVNHEEVVDQNHLVQDDIQQQESISFDQSGSSAEYLRASGADITLNVDDVLAGVYNTPSLSAPAEV